MKQAYRGIVYLFCCACLCMTARAQNITQAEYFFDSDPGYGSGTQISIATPAPNISGLSFNAGVSALSNGIHTLFIRTKDANGRWSQTYAHTMAKVQPMFPNPSAASAIVQAEYFIDTDPGYGNGTTITLTPAVNISALSFNVDLSSVSTGLHTLYVRTKDATGWSIVSSTPFAKVQGTFGNPNATSNITKVEYFFDSDPGFGNGIDVPITAAANISGLVFNANVSSLSQGMHTLYVRSRDAQGKWSVVNSINFAKVQGLFTNPNSSGNIVKMEYFFDTDPGFGNGVDVPLTSGTDISNFTFNANVNTLLTGLHTLYVRTKDAQGKWSITFQQQFTRIQGLNSNPAQVSKITKAEYFFDTDPGFGNGINIPLTPGIDISALSFNADISALSNGVHTLFVRSCDSLGQWSTTNHLGFAKVQPLFNNLNTQSNIVKLEYFFDADPGFGNGTDVPVVSGLNISSLAFNANVSALNNGVHTLYVRSKDAQGKWSVVNETVFARVQPLIGNPNTQSNIVQIEYFVDTDPGIGNGIWVPLSSDTNVTALSLNVDMTVLVNGSHILYIRSKDAQGKWSITNSWAFNGGTAPLAMSLISFDAKLLEDKKVILEWITAYEADVADYTIERSYDASRWTVVGKKLPLGGDPEKERVYQMVDEEPGTGIVYYRLTETDINGQKTQAPIRFVQINENAIADAVLYPNPNDGTLINIRSAAFTEGDVLIHIIGADGKVCFSQTIPQQTSPLTILSDLHLATGNYFINLQGKNKTETLKLQVTGKTF